MLTVRLSLGPFRFGLKPAQPHGVQRSGRALSGAVPLPGSPSALLVFAITLSGHLGRRALQRCSGLSRSRRRKTPSPWPGLGPITSSRQVAVFLSVLSPCSPCAVPFKTVLESLWSGGMFGIAICRHGRPQNAALGPAPSLACCWLWWIVPRLDRWPPAVWCCQLIAGSMLLLVAGRAHRPGDGLRR